MTYQLEKSAKIMDQNTLWNLTVILVRPKSSENIGSVVRACSNMDCPNLILVKPRNFDPQRALGLATARGKRLLEESKITDTLAQALAPFQRVVATTARKGGKWRDNLWSPSQIAPLIAKELTNNTQVALVFGPEDSGLSNKEIQYCRHFVTIPTNDQACSLNLSQAVLILLYECFKYRIELFELSPTRLPSCQQIPHFQLQDLLSHFRSMLVKSGFIPSHNKTYFMLPFKRFFERIGLQHNEYKLFMAFCRHIDWFLTKDRDERPPHDQD